MRSAFVGSGRLLCKASRRSRFSFSVTFNLSVTSTSCWRRCRNSWATGIAAELPFFKRAFTFDSCRMYWLFFRASCTRATISIRSCLSTVSGNRCPSTRSSSTVITRRPWRNTPVRSSPLSCCWSAETNRINSHSCCFSADTRPVSIHIRRYTSNSFPAIASSAASWGDFRSQTLMSFARNGILLDPNSVADVLGNVFASPFLQQHTTSSPNASSTIRATWQNV